MFEYSIVMGEHIFFVILMLKFIEKGWIAILKWAKSEEKLFLRGGLCEKKLDRAPAFFLAADAHGVAPGQVMRWKSNSFCIHFVLPSYIFC